MNDHDSRKIIRRLERLEKAVFGSGRKRVRDAAKEQGFTGPSGGVRLLISKNFFKTKRNLGDVRKALGENDYHYGSAQVQTSLNRLSTRAGPLAASTEGGKKFYVRRK
jgi:hypothetical protein